MNDKCWCECKNPREHPVWGQNYIWNPATCSWENGKYIGSIIVDSVITCDEIIEETKTVPTKSISTKTILIKCTSKNLHFTSLIIALLVIVTIYCFFIKWEAKQKPLLPCHSTISKLKETGY